jgi:peptide-methionine (S)-S-oxide reductase
VRDTFQTALKSAGRPSKITPKIAPAGEFYYAENYCQQYLAQNPDGHCGLGGTGMSCPIG